MTARVVMTPADDDATFFDSPDAAAALADVQAGVGRLPERDRHPTRPARSRRSRPPRSASGRSRPTVGSRC